MAMFGQGYRPGAFKPMSGSLGSIQGGVNKIGSAIKGLTAESDSTKDQRANVQETANRASNFADTGEAGVAALGAEAGASRDYLRQVAGGQHSVSAEQLRQGLQQNVAAQRSMAAGASPANSAMAARTAMIQGGRMGMGMSGQAAAAGLQERRNAQDALAQMIMQQRGQDMQAALNSRQTAQAGYQGIRPEGSTLEKYMPVVNAGLGGLGQLNNIFGEKPKKPGQ